MGYRRYDLLEEIRFLLNGEKYDSGSPLTLVLAGQPELWDTLRLDRCRAITQRIVYVCRTGNLPRDQVGSYIAAHLRWAGVQDLLFSSEAVDHIAGLSEGLPRLINKICLHSLSYAALEKRKTVDITTADRAARNEVVEVMLKEEMKE